MNTKTIVKFIIATTVFYLFLAGNIFHIGDLLSPKNKDYVDNNIAQEEWTLEEIYFENSTYKATTGHFSANETTDIADICDSTNICDKIQFNGQFTDTEKYSYIKIINKITNFIDENSNEETPINEVIDIIEISKEHGNRRGYATRNTIIFNIWSVQSKKEFIELSTHEIGHITDLGYIQWSASKKDKNFTEFGHVVFAINDLSLLFYKLSRNNETIRKSTTKKKDFCSWYGMSDPFEDFAECFNLYTNHNSFFRQIAKTNPILKKKYNHIANIFEGEYISSNSQDLKLIKTNSTRRPRDTTKLSIN